MNQVSCAGWWEQRGLGRQPMTDLRLTFADERIVGRGVDIIGKFTLEGRLHNLLVTITKQYIGAHQVEYIGSFDGEGTLQGVWNLFGVSGRWLIHVQRVEQARDDIVDL